MHTLLTILSFFLIPSGMFILANGIQSKTSIRAYNFHIENIGYIRSKRYRKKIIKGTLMIISGLIILLI